MGLHIKHFENGFLGLTFGSADVAINPAGKEIHHAFNETSSQLIKAAGNQFNFYLEEKNDEDPSKPIITSGYELETKKGIKYIVNTRIVLTESSEPDEIEIQLRAFYKNSLNAACRKKPTSIAVPIIIINNNLFTIEKSLHLAFTEIDTFSCLNPSIHVLVILNDQNSLNLFNDIKNNKNLNTEHHIDNTGSNEAPSPAHIPNSPPENEEQIEYKKPFKSLSLNSYSLFTSNNSKSFIDLDKIEPSTPTIIQGTLTKPLRLEKTTKSKMQATWESISNGKINEILVERNSQITDLKFLLGPAIYPIKCYYEQGLLNKLNWELYQINLNYSYLQRAQKGIDIYLNYIKHNKIFSLKKKDIKNSKLVILRHQFKTEKEKYQSYFQNGLEIYFDYMQTKLKGDISVQITAEWVQIKQKEDGEIKNHSELKSLLETWIKSWSDSFTQEWLEKNTLDDIQKSNFIKMHSNLLISNQNALMKLIDNTQYIDELIKKITSECKKIMSEKTKIRQKIQSQEKEYQLRINEETNSYRKLATQWLSIDINYSKMIRILSADESSFEGITTPDLIELIVEYNSNLDLNTRMPTTINACRESLEKRDTLKEEFRKELKKQMPDPSLENLVGIAKFLHQYLPNIKPHIASISDENEREITTLLVSNTRSILTARVNTPLEWNELSSALNFIACKSEAQQLLKNKLTTYIHKRDPELLSNKISNACYDKKKLIARRRQISYLISCLYIASAQCIDENILFNSLSNSVENVGVNLILEHLQHSKTSSSNLKDVLLTYVEKMKDPNVYYLAKIDDKSPLLNLNLTSSEIISKAIIPLTLPKVTYTYDQKAIEKLSDERAEEIQLITLNNKLR